MFSKVFKLGSWFTAEVQVIKHDVEAIIANFTDTVAKLEDAADAKMAEAQLAAKKSIEFEALADAAYTASEKATKVAGHIKALVS